MNLHPARVRLLLSASFLSVALSAQTYFRAAPAGSTGPLRRLVVGNLVPDQGATRVDAAVVMRDTVSLVYRPDTWGSFHTWVAAGVDDIALLARPNEPSDALLTVGGPTPTLLTYAGGFQVTPLPVTGWGGIRTLAAVRDGDTHLVAGINRFRDALRIGRVQWDGAPSFQQLTNGAVLADGLVFDVAWTDFNNDGLFEAVVANAAGLSLYTPNGLRSVLIPAPSVAGFVSSLQHEGRARILWLSKATASANWTVRLLDSSSNVGPLPLLLPAGAPEPIGGITVTGLESGPVAAGRDGALISFRLGSEPSRMAAYELDFESALNAGTLVAGVQDAFAGSLAYQDVDGDQVADALRSCSGEIGIEISSPTLRIAPLPETTILLLDRFGLTSTGGAGSTVDLELVFLPSPDTWLDLTIYRRHWHAGGPAGLSFITQRTGIALGATDTVVNDLGMPPMPPMGDSYGAFYIEATYYDASGESLSVIYLLYPEEPFNHQQTAAIGAFMDQHIPVGQDPAPIRGYDRMNIIKRPSKIEIILDDGPPGG